ncbi:MAG TPA: hypothetical protein VM802_28475, partial [Chitinophaga sp.]|uniref:hypothetical protein n=1 Tax=Chitinophaga sp. TaxID=1869181 RepID=UPI002CBEA883
MKILNLLTLVSLFIFVSCRKNVSEKAETNISMKSLDHDREMTDFAKVLAKSLTDINVRSLIKQEAEKMFDKDYDVLYGLAKDLPDVTGKTLNEQIVKFSNNPSQFNSIVNQLPLLTIYVPVLDNFDAKKWNIDGQIPIVAVRNTEDRKNGKPLLAYDADGNEIKLDYKVKPDRPIIVIKDNERVIKKSTEVKNNLNARGNEVTPVKIKDDYYFADESYNG